MWSPATKPTEWQGQEQAQGLQGGAQASHRPRSLRGHAEHGTYSVDLQVINATEVQLTIPGSIFWRKAWHSVI